ncbi:YdeI/OmpD-associated family protein [Flavobacterium sp.]|uniref:YdeI/OmpD-associated family protein n=1 Tax=Flavobacterium sp. TaxID=239 RepID=UPI0039E6090C
MNPKVDFFFDQAGQWQAAVAQLRDIVLGIGLTEELKWGCPCYTINGNNLVLIHHFKEYCALLFFKGALLQDTDGILVQQTKNVQAARQIRFTQTNQILEQQKIIKTYIYQAIEVEKAGLKVALKTTEDFTVTAEFQQKLNDNPNLKKAFEALTPGRQRNYLLYFSSAKQAKTRMARIEKCLPQILDGKGLNDTHA